jgi:Oxidoreductase-like protein, N-terminal
MEDEEVTKPLEPGKDDCCGSGCVPCVFDAYEEKLKKYNEWLTKKKE